MNKPHLETASEALQGLVNNPEALKKLDVALTEFKHDLGIPMNDTTFRYVVNAVVNQKVVDGADPDAETEKTTLPGGFQILAAVKVYTAAA